MRLMVCYNPRTNLLSRRASAPLLARNANSKTSLLFENSEKKKNQGSVRSYDTQGVMRNTLPNPLLDILNKSWERVRLPKNR